MNPFDQQRRIGLHHIAFFRSCFESTLDLQDVADRYLETGKDLAAARRTLKMIQGALIKVALRQGKHGEARLLRLPRGSLTSKAQATQGDGIDAGDQTVLTLAQFLPKYDPNQIGRAS